MASQKNMDVYLETVEVAKNKGSKPNEIRNARVGGISKRKHP